MGSTVIPRAAFTMAVVLLGVCAGGASVWAGGVYLGLEAYTLDMTGTWAQVPVAASDAFDELLTMLSDQGIPPAGLAEISADFAEAVANLDAAVSAFPPLLPVPLVALGVEIPLPWVVIDGVRVSVGFLDDRLVCGLATGLLGIVVPVPLVDETVDVGDDTATFTADLAASTWMISIDALKRFDVVFLGADFILGGDVLWGSVTPAVEFDVPEEWDVGVGAALAALRLDEISWSALGLHAGIGFEIGLPFLRLYAEARFLLPISLSDSWWDLCAGALGGALGMVIRF
jgi:hypothetical protein